MAPCSTGSASGRCRHRRNTHPDATCSPARRRRRADSPAGHRRWRRSVTRTVSAPGSDYCQGRRSARRASPWRGACGDSRRGGLWWLRRDRRRFRRDHWFRGGTRLWSIRRRECVRRGGVERGRRGERLVGRVRNQWIVLLWRALVEREQPHTRGQEQDRRDDRARPPARLRQKCAQARRDTSENLTQRGQERGHHDSFREAARR